MLLNFPSLLIDLFKNEEATIEEVVTEFFFYFILVDNDRKILKFFCVHKIKLPLKF